MQKPLIGGSSEDRKRYWNFWNILIKSITPSDFYLPQI